LTFVTAVLCFFVLGQENQLFFLGSIDHDNKTIEKSLVNNENIIVPDSPLDVGEDIGELSNLDSINKEYMTLEDVKNKEKNTNLFWHLKLVPLDVTDKDLDLIAAAGFYVLESEEGVDEVSIEEMRQMLDRVYEHGMRMIVDAGFSAGAWGYHDDGSDPVGQKPVWQKEKMQNWVEKLKDHPAIYGWDISNEAGENLPNGDRFRVSLSQLKQSSADIRAIDSTRPIIVRMHYWEKWDEEDYDFDWQNPFDRGIADIVMLNLYSNYSEDGVNAILPNMVSDSAQILIDKILFVDPDVRIWLSLAAFEEEPLFLKQNVAKARQNIENALSLKIPESIGFFGWGDIYDDWYLPRDDGDLLTMITEIIKK